VIEFRVLGPLEVLYDGRPVTIPAAKQRALLTVLLLRAGTTVPGPRLIEELWGEDAPISARKVVQTYISKLRRVLPPGVLVTRPTGYALRADPGCVDAASFERLLAEAAPADPEDEADLLRCALALWRGGALEDFADEPFAQADISRLEGLRLEALERRIELDVAAGRHAAVVGELAALVREHPFHEPLRGQLMLALYRAGRQDEALGAYQEGRRLLVDQLGVQPSLPLRRRQQAILRGEDWVDPPGAPGLQRRPGSATAAVPRTREAGRGGDAPGRTRSRLVGRARELAELQDLLLRHRLVTLIGPAGIGKTRLALEASARMREAFPDGRFVVDLTTLQDPRLVAPAACSALGSGPRGRRTPRRTWPPS
jgi:DNA-binding SARP family transcriptional activator